MTEQDIEQLREQQRRLETCACGRKKSSPFFVCCDACFPRLPRDLRRAIATGRETREQRLAARQFLAKVNS